MPVAYKTVHSIIGPLAFVQDVQGVAYDELCEFETTGGEKRLGRVLEVSSDRAVVQMFEPSQGFVPSETKARFLGKSFTFGVSEELLGRVFSGSGVPIDGIPALLGGVERDINGAAINPASREFPRDFIQTGISAIDVLNTLVRGQKLPIFSGAGLPHSRLAAQIARQARVLTQQEVETGKPVSESESGGGEKFAVIFAAMGVTFEESQYFVEEFQRTGALSRAVLFLNTAADSVVERIATPRLALTAAEYLAYDCGYHVTVILTDMTNYCLEGDTEVILSDGRIVPIKELIDSPHSASVFTHDGCRVRIGNVTHGSRIPAPKKLLRIRTRSGAEMRVTSDHKILVDSNDGPMMIPAGRLSVGDEIYAARQISVARPWRPALLELLAKSKATHTLFAHMKNEVVNTVLQKRFGSVRRGAHALGLCYDRFVDSSHKRRYSVNDLCVISNATKTSMDMFSEGIDRVTAGKHEGLRVAHDAVGENLMYLLGLIDSDGSVYENSAQGAYYVSFTNKEIDLINHFVKTTRTIFPAAHVQIHPNQNGVWMARINSRMVVELAKSFGIHKDIKPIFRLPESWIACFLRGYFDGDGCCRFKYKDGRVPRIQITSNKKTQARRLQQLLRRLGIVSGVRFRTGKGISGTSSVYDVTVEGAKPVAMFAQHVGSHHRRKSERLKQAAAARSGVTTSFERAPRVTAKLLRQLRERYNVRAIDLGRSSTISQVETGARRTSRENFRKILEILQEKVAQDDPDLIRLAELVTDDTVLDDIVAIDEVKPKERVVYDIRVEPSHNFAIANGLFVSNCEALREIASARKEVPGRRGYPGYLYTDLASIYERAGRIQGKEGSITQIPILTMPEDDVTHPIPDLTGYITEGQILLNRGMYQKGIIPPIIPMGSLSRLKSGAQGEGITREDHKGMDSQLTASYARGVEVRELAVILGESSLSETDRLYLKFADRFEEEFIKQGEHENRSIFESLEIGWSILQELPREELKRLDDEHIEKYLKL